MKDEDMELFIKAIANLKLWKEDCAEFGNDPDAGQGMDWLQGQDECLEGLITQARAIVGHN